MTEWLGEAKISQSHDLALLRLLYCPSISSGMDKHELVLAALKSGECAE